MTQPISGERLLVPGTVALTPDGYVAWHDERSTPPKTATPPRDLLEQFVALHAEPDTAIQRFASRWGLLGICDHGIPRTHHLPMLVPRELSLEPGDEEGPCLPVGFTSSGRRIGGAEPITAWREWTQRAHDALVLGSAARDNRSPDEAAWNRAIHEPYRATRKTTAITKLVQYWLTVSGVRPQFSWTSEGPSVAFGTRGTWDQLPKRPSLLWSHQHGSMLIGVLALQLAARIAQSDALAICSACQGPYAPKRAPVPGRRRYCPRCKADGAHWRDAQRAHRAAH